MKTLNKIMIAASVAMTIGTASATSVPGLGNDVFEFTKPGIADGAIVVGTGVDAIANINKILDAVGGTGGSTLNQGNFWGSSVAKTEVDVFEYDAAAPMIAELIFAVKGEAYDPATKTYEDAGSVNTYVLNDANVVISTSTAKVDFLATTSNTGTGNYVDGKLSHTKSKAIDLMRLLNFTASEQSLAWETNNTLSATGDATTNPTNDSVTFTGPDQVVNSSLITDGTFTTDSITGEITSDRNSTVELAVAAASLNKQGFINANSLVALIADQLKTGYILDVSKATANLKAIADHHTGFLSASLVNQAHGLKAAIRNLGYLEASVGVGKGARIACVDTGGSTNKEIASCTKIGHQFKSLATKVQSVTDAGLMADAYASTILAINAFADKIISFNDTVGTFDPATEAGLINSQFGTITVDTGSQLYTDLENGTAPTEADISGLGTSDLVDLDGIFDTEMVIYSDLGDDNLVGGTGANADTTTTIILE